MQKLVGSKKVFPVLYCKNICSEYYERKIRMRTIKVQICPHFDAVKTYIRIRSAVEGIYYFTTYVILKSDIPIS